MNMNITTTPDTYTPSVDETGNYVDNIPVIKNGLFCPCGSRKEKTYENTSKFATHIKTKSHQKWLTLLNQNKANYYIELLQHKELVENQQKIITQLENQLHKKNLTIDYLTEQVISKTTPKVTSVDLLDIN
jgi:hypothetical protein